MKNIYYQLLTWIRINELAYERLKSKPGNMTPGVDSETRVAAVSPYGFSLKHVERGLRDKSWLGKALDRAKPPFRFEPSPENSFLNQTDIFGR